MLLDKVLVLEGGVVVMVGMLKITKEGRTKGDDGADDDTNDEVVWRAADNGSNDDVFFDRVSEELFNSVWDSLFNLSDFVSFASVAFGTFVKAAVVTAVETADVVAAAKVVADIVTAGDEEAEVAVLLVVTAGGSRVGSGKKTINIKKNNNFSNQIKCKYDSVKLTSEVSRTLYYELWMKNN